MKIFAKAPDYIKALFEKCLKEDGVNSRLVFFLHGVISALCILVLSIAFIFSKSHDGYDYMIMALGTSGGAAAVGRYFTKKNSNGPQTEDPAPDDGKDDKK